MTEAEFMKAAQELAHELEVHAELCPAKDGTVYVNDAGVRRIAQMLQKMCATRPPAEGGAA